jgi:hypothetical protein
MKLSAKGQAFQNRVASLIDDGLERAEAVAEAASEDQGAHEAFVHDHQAAADRGESIALPRRVAARR